MEQQYLPDAIKDVKYYTFGDNKNEQASRALLGKDQGRRERLSHALHPKSKTKKKENDMRYSKQRELVMQTVQNLCDHPTAEEIYDAAVKECPG